MRFRTRLMVSYLALILILTGGFYLFFKSGLQKAMIEESRVNLMNQALLVKMLVEQDVRRTRPQDLAQRIGGSLKARVTLVAPDGTVAGDSDVDEGRVPQLENHLMRPEIQEALKRGTGSAVRFSDTLQRHMVYVALPAGSGFIRLALPLDHVAHATAMLHGVLGVVLLLTILCALVASYTLSNMTSRPLREIAAAAIRIGSGEQSVSIPVRTGDEVGDLARVINEMAGRIDSHVKSLAAEKQRLDTILKGMGEGVLVTDATGTITLVNPALRSQLGITGPVEGKRLIEITRHPDLLTAFNDLRTHGGELVREIAIVPASRTLLTHWAPLVVDGVDHGVVAVLHDITDMKRVETMRRDFVANVSHELRTPVSVIKGYAETLLDGVMETDQGRAVRFVEIILQHAQRLAALINDILTLSQLESKEAALDLRPLDPAATVAKSCGLVHEGAERKGIQIINEIREGRSLVMADQSRLEQVLVNLLENAIKYTPEGGSVRTFMEDDAAFLKVSVADTGIGIPFKDLPRIFERFYRVDEARSREQGGTGLGLSIVKHIVHLHGGDVSVTSEQGRGSIFSFTLRKA